MSPPLKRLLSPMRALSPAARALSSFACFVAVNPFATLRASRSRPNLYCLACCFYDGEPAKQVAVNLGRKPRIQ